MTKADFSIGFGLAMKSTASAICTPSCRIAAHPNHARLRTPLSGRRGSCPARYLALRTASPTTMFAAMKARKTLAAICVLGAVAALFAKAVR